jgi:hypothetical protein
MSTGRQGSIKEYITPDMFPTKEKGYAHKINLAAC